ncbi:hypothetical protein KCP78_21765 [Salmonella enterica subsp. enterica]|nr:hypothetical protein KCP78_21765 [Salmonella enterica subsp. enterica]
MSIRRCSLSAWRSPGIWFFSATDNFRQKATVNVSSSALSLSAPKRDLRRTTRACDTLLLSPALWVGGKSEHHPATSGLPAPSPRRTKHHWLTGDDAPPCRPSS